MIDLVDSMPPDCPPAFRAGHSGDLAWMLRTWSEGYKGSPAMHRKVWRDYKAMDVPQLAVALRRHDTRLMVAVDEELQPVGWLAYAQWPSIDVVHWVHTNFKHRRMGVMRSLLEKAALKKRVIYTHQAEKKRRGGERSDERIKRMLEQRGRIVTYTPYQEWAR